jgi:hypothetical protein
MGKGYLCEIEFNPPSGNAAAWKHVRGKLAEYTGNRDEHGILRASGITAGVKLPTISELRRETRRMAQQDAHFIEDVFFTFSRAVYSTREQLAAKLRADFPRELVDGVTIDGVIIF